MVLLSRNELDLGTIYAGVPERVKSGTLSIKNYGNIPAQFCWEERLDSEGVVARFEPLRGVVPPGGETKVQV